VGFLSGRRPESLGVRDGALAPTRSAPNNVSSQADPKTDRAHFVKPIAIRGDPGAAFQALKDLLHRRPRTKVIVELADYVHAECASPMLGFVDDLEFLLDRRRKVIHVRSAARLGYSDFGANRKRVEALRKALAQGAT